MRSIVLLNAKGGCGKTTLTTNLAGYYASQGKAVLLADFDPQGSSVDWLAARPADRPAIEGVRAWRSAWQVSSSSLMKCAAARMSMGDGSTGTITASAWRTRWLSSRPAPRAGASMRK